MDMISLNGFWQEMKSDTIRKNLKNMSTKLPQQRRDLVL